jgi:hypothetical protein
MAQTLDTTISLLLKPLWQDGLAKNQARNKKLKIINQISRNWQAIVGGAFSSFSSPQTLKIRRNSTNYSSASLVVNVRNSAIAFLLQSQSQQIIERVNRFAVDSNITVNKISFLQQGNIAENNNSQKPESWRNQHQKLEKSTKIENIIKNIADQELQDLLRSLAP